MTQTASIALHPSAAENAERTAARSMRVNERQYLFPDLPDHLIPDGYAADMADAFDRVVSELQPHQRHPVSTDHVTLQVLSACPFLADTPAGTEGVRAFVGEGLLSLALAAGALRTQEALAALSFLEIARTPDGMLFGSL